jgi:membrane protein
MKRINLIKLLRQTFTEWNQDKAPQLAAALSYYTAFAIAPLLVIVIAVAGLVLGPEAARGRIEGEIRGLVGTEAASAIQDILANANQPTTGIISTIVSVVTLLLGATGFFGQLQDSLNTIWGVKTPARSIIETIRVRFVSFSMILGIGFLLLVSLIVSAVLAGVSEYVNSVVPSAEFLSQLINFLISFGVITVMFAMIYKVLPDVEIAWSDVWLGAVVTSLLFNLGKYLIGLYLGQSGVASAYGAAGSFVLLLLWVNYSAQILLLGAEFTQVYANMYGSKIVAEGAKATATAKEAAAQVNKDVNLKRIPAMNSRQPEASAAQSTEVMRKGSGTGSGFDPLRIIQLLMVALTGLQVFLRIRDRGKQT